MFYNTYRATKSAFKKRQLSGNLSHVNPKERLLNLPKRQKLKKLLVEKFMQKYNISNPDDVLDPVITEFIQSEKLNDTDLKRLDIKIQRLLKDKTLKDNLKSNLTNNLQGINLEENPLQTDANVVKKKNLLPPTDTKAPTEKNNTLENNKEFPSLAPTNGYTNTISNTGINNKNRGFSSYMPRNKRFQFFKTPEEELAELEKEFAEENKKGKNSCRRIEFANDGDEWNAILRYNKRLYDKKVLEDKLKDKEIKKRTKDYLDLQVKEKIRKEYEDELKDKEYDKIIKEHSKELDEMERIKAQKIKEQIQRLKEHRDVQLKNEKMRKRIEELKEKKFENNLVKNYKESLERARKEKMERKRRENEALKKAIKENEIKQQLLKEKIKKEKEDEIKMNEERIKLDIRQENERKRYYEQIKKNGEKYSMVEADQILEKLKKDQKAEEDKIQHYYDEKNREANEKEAKERFRRQKERESIKKYLDMQVEEKKKEENFLRLLDEEQARIWNIDCKKYFDDEKDVEKKIKLMNKLNFDALMNQIEEKKRSKSRQNTMSDNEYAMNKDILEKAQIEENAPIAQ
jgi:hypothetical protein